MIKKDYCHDDQKRGTPYDHKVVSPRASPGPKCLKTAGRSQNSRKVSGHRQLLSSAGLDHAADSRIEVFRCLELLNGEVHTVTPVVAWVGRDIDALIIRVASAKGAVHGEPVLKRKHGKHCR